eukprot:scaffold33317_cov124-Cyclotella_meneghiniana.AAC.1
MRIRGPQPLADRTKAFLGFRVLGWRFMIRFAYLDMIYYLEEEFGCNWQDLPRLDSSGKLTKLGWTISGFTNVKRRRYLIGSTRLDLKAIIKYFAVPKGEKDWRIVYDATASGLNECVWAPSFWLPT